jgi:hypothetical protein
MFSDSVSGIAEFESSSTTGSKKAFGKTTKPRNATGRNASGVALAERVCSSTFMASALQRADLGVRGYSMKNLKTASICEGAPELRIHMPSPTLMS